MGKTSIGWLIAMSQIANGWQAVECNTPTDVFRVYESKEKQVFIADDALGERNSTSIAERSGRLTSPKSSSGSARIICSSGLAGSTF